MALFRESPKWWWTQEAPCGLSVWTAWPLLRLAEMGYARAIRSRNRSYDRREQAGQVFRPSVPVIAVGNLTVGGSGKTPVAMWLARSLHQRGRRPAIIARGYGAAGGQLNDEMTLARRKCPYAVVLANPNRPAAIDEATGSHGADVVILDDAFQHRRVQRDLDIVLVDATRGFGNGHLLPAGPLREPVESLQRAGLVLVTRTEQVPTALVDALVQRIGELKGQEVPVGRIAFQPAGLMDLAFQPADMADGPSGVFAGIGNFQAFVQTCRQRGVNVGAELALVDHVRYDADVCERISRWAEASKVRWLVTTEKDAVKLSEMGRAWPMPMRVLGIEVVADAETRGAVDRAIGTILG